MKIAILDDFLDVVRSLKAFGKLDGHDVKIWNDHTEDVEVLASRLQDVEALVLQRERTPIPAALVRRLPKLKVISLSGVYPHIDLEACTKAGIVVSTTNGTRPSYATAELAWGLIIAAFRNLPQEIAGMKAGRWQSAMGTCLRGNTLGVFGFGRIGPVIAKYGDAFGMKVMVWGRQSSLEKAKSLGYQTAASQEEFFSSCDVITLFLRAVKETEGIVKASDLALMKPTSLLVNTARASLIEPGALVRALKAGRPGMAAVDVFDVEPVLNADDPLLHMKNVICTPHIGGVDILTQEFLFRLVFDQVLAYKAGSPINVVNPDVLKH